MADIVLRNLDESLKEKLRLAAAKNNRSMNANCSTSCRRP